MKTVRTVLNELKWRTDRDFTKVEVEYVHRGGPADLATVEGGDIMSLEAWMMVIRRKELPEQLPGRRVVTAVPGETAIPYHRVTRVLYEGKVVFDRKAGRDLLDEPGARSEPQELEAPGEDEGIYPEPPARAVEEPHHVDAQEDDVTAAGIRDDERPPAKAGGLHPIGAHSSKPPLESGGLLSDEVPSKRTTPGPPKKAPPKKGGKAVKKPAAGKKGKRK